MMGEPSKLEHRGGELVALRGNQLKAAGDLAPVRH